MKILLNVLIGLSIVALLLSFDGVLQTMMFSGAPNYSPERAEYNINFYMTASGISLASLLFFILLCKRVKA